jgi:hypothetical protein
MKMPVVNAAATFAGAADGNQDHRRFPGRSGGTEPARGYAHNDVGSIHGSIGVGFRFPGKQYCGNGGEYKQQQYDPVGGIADRETPIRLEQEGGEHHASHRGDKQARQATPKVSYRNDYKEEYCRGRWL